MRYLPSISCLPQAAFTLESGVVKERQKDRKQEESVVFGWSPFQTSQKRNPKNNTHLDSLFKHGLTKRSLDLRHPQLHHRKGSFPHGFHWKGNPAGKCIGLYATGHAKRMPGLTDLGPWLMVWQTTIHCLVLQTCALFSMTGRDPTLSFSAQS